MYLKWILILFWGHPHCSSWAIPRFYCVSNFISIPTDWFYGVTQLTVNLLAAVTFHVGEIAEVDAVETLDVVSRFQLVRPERLDDV